MKTLLFIDECTPKNYDPEIIASEAVGGTEATVSRIAEALAKTGDLWVTVEQRTRTPLTRWTSPSGVHYFELNNSPHADIVVSLRDPDSLLKSKERFPKARHFSLQEDLCNPTIAKGLCAQRGFTLLSVSNFHRTQILEHLKAQSYSGEFPVKVVYNPVDEDLAPDGTEVNPNKLVFFSSPHKGLEYTLQVFQNLRSFNPDFKLYIANPGYLTASIPEIDNLVILGPLPHKDAIKHVRESLCVFYPNTVFPETFGCVFSEANAVGTPVLTHPIGAATEVLWHPNEVMDCRNPKTVIDRVLAWRNGDRPRVKLNSKFRMSEVLKTWIRLLQD